MTTRLKVLSLFAVALLGATMLLPTKEAPADAAGATITSANWGEKVGFVPDLTDAPAVGTRIDESNWERFRKWIPLGIDTLVSRYKLKLEVSAYEAVHPSMGYIAATNEFLGVPQLVDTGGDPRKLAISGYTAGLPFPNPDTGEKVAYNYQYAYLGDDGGYHYGVYWISAATGVERWEEWRWEYITRVQYRTDLDPRPTIPELAAEGVAYRSMTWAVAPQDKRGFAALYSRMAEPADQQGWIYLPPTRRTLRMSFGTRGDAWNSTDLLYEDVRGFMGYPEWMNWTLKGRETVLAPIHAGIPHGKEALERAFDFRTWPHWNLRCRWEPRPMYVVEATPRLPDYPYSKMVFYFDAETYLIPIKIAYDKKGDLWKVLINAFNASPDMDSMPLQIGTAVVIDLQSEHATAFPAYEFTSNVGHDPNRFTLTNLRKMGK